MRLASPWIHIYIDIKTILFKKFFHTYVIRIII